MKTSKQQSDVLVIGAGAGGMSVAYWLALQGVDVEVVEFGSLPDPKSEFLTDLWPDSLLLRGLDKGGMEYYCPTHFVEPYNASYKIGKEVGNSWLKRTRVVGGKTLYWTAHSPRFSDYEFKAETVTGRGQDWPISYKDIAYYYTKAEKIMGVCGTKEGLEQQPDGEFLPAFELRKGEKILQKVLGSSGIRLIPARKAILTKPLGAGTTRAICHQCGRCYLGCKTSAKFDAFTGFYKQSGGKIRLRSNSVVTEIVSDRDSRKVIGLKCLDRVTKEESLLKARVIVVAASAIESARILLNSLSLDRSKGLANSSDCVGRYLAESTGVSIEGLLPELKGTQVDNEDGSGEHGLIPRFLNLKKQQDFAGGFLYVTQSGAEIFPSFAARLPGFGEELKQSIKAWFPAAIRLYGIAPIESCKENRIMLDSSKSDDWGIPVVKVQFSLSQQDRKLWQAMHDYGLEFLNDANCDQIATDTSEPLTGGGLHACGTCRMGKDPKNSVVNSFGQTHDIRNLFVADASVFVCSLNQPTLTLIALALRTADFITEGLRYGDF
ncbi:MAG: GMC family oxidoreductase [Blastocatellia bacterium]|nr:GMC family oxidoreductase [Blastocatellia bacterium]